MLQLYHFLQTFNRNLILSKIKLPLQTDFQPNVLILILTVRFKFRMLWLLALTCQCISHFSLVNGPQGNREMPNKLMIGPDQSLLFNFRRNHLRTSTVIQNPRSRSLIQKWSSYKNIFSIFLVVVYIIYFDN